MHDAWRFLQYTKRILRAQSENILSALAVHPLPLYPNLLLPHLLADDFHGRAKTRRRAPGVLGVDQRQQRGRAQARSADVAPFSHWRFFGIYISLSL